MAQRKMKFVLSLLLASYVTLTPLYGGVHSTAGQGAAPQGTQGSASPPASASSADAGLKDTLARIQATAHKADSDLARVHIDKWKADAASKQNAQASADSIRRNLTNAIPELLERVEGSPASLSANFKLYRDLNALFDIFSTLAEAAGAFGPPEHYSLLAGDVAQLDQARQKLADRVDGLAVADDADLARLRAKPAVSSTATPAAAPTKVVVDDNQGAPRKKRKSQPASTPN